MSGDLKSLRRPPVVGFAFFGPCPYPCLKYRHFQATSRGGLASGPPERPAQDREAKVAGLEFLKNLVNHKKGEGVP